jgi:hypothetical protein
LHFVSPHLNPLQPRAALALAVAQGEDFEAKRLNISILRPSPLKSKTSSREYQRILFRSTKEKESNSYSWQGKDDRPFA